MRSRHVSLPRLRWRTTPGSSTRRQAGVGQPLQLGDVVEHRQPGRPRAGRAVAGRAVAGAIDGDDRSRRRRRRCHVEQRDDGAAARRVTTASIFIALITSSASPAPTRRRRHPTSTTVPPIGVRTACWPGRRRGRRSAVAVAPAVRPSTASATAAPVGAGASPAPGLGEQRRAGVAGAHLGRARMREQLGRFVGSPRVEAPRRRGGAVDASATSGRADEPMTLASSGSNCGGGA
jgi:hypothetical protein